MWINTFRSFCKQNMCIISYKIKNFGGGAEAPIAYLATTLIQYIINRLHDLHKCIKRPLWIFIILEVNIRVLCDTVKLLK